MRALLIFLALAGLLAPPTPPVPCGCGEACPCGRDGACSLQVAKDLLPSEGVVPADRSKVWIDAAGDDVSSRIVKVPVVQGVFETGPPGRRLLFLLNRSLLI